MLISTRDTAAELLQIQINACLHFCRNREIEGPPSLGVRSGYVERPCIPTFCELFGDAQRCERAAAQRYERQESNDQTVAVSQSVRLICSPCGICIGDCTIHEFDPEQIEPIAGYQMIFSGSSWRCDSYPLNDGRQPRPVSTTTNELQRATKVRKIGGQRDRSA